MADGRGDHYVEGVPIKLFVFEDHWMCREALISVLSRHPGIEIVGDADNVDEGLQRALAAQPQVVLMDIRFEREYLGIEATETLKDKLPQTKVIIFTELHEQEHLRGAIQAGASGFLLKHDVRDPDTIVDAIRAVHLGDGYMTPAMAAKIVQLMRGGEQPAASQLTKREVQVLRLLAHGSSNREIGKQLDIEERTVANHVSNILFKLSAKNRTEAAAIGRQSGLL